MKTLIFDVVLVGAGVACLFSPYPWVAAVFITMTMLTGDYE